MDITDSGTKNLLYSPAGHTRALEFTKGFEAKTQLVMKSSFAWPVSCAPISLGDLAVDQLWQHRVQDPRTPFSLTI